MKNLIALNREDLQECQSFIYGIMESQNNKVKPRQKAKSDRLINKQSKGYMYNDMVSNFGMFCRYPYDSFGGHPNHIKAMVIPHTSPTSKDNNNSNNINMDTASTNNNNSNRDSTTTKMANTIPNTISANNLPDNHKSKWVINLSSTPLNQPQKTLLVSDPNFTVIPKCPPGGLHSHGGGSLQQTLPHVGIGAKVGNQQDTQKELSFPQT